MLAIADVLHTNPLRDAQRGKVAGVDVRDDAFKSYSMKPVFSDWAGGLRRKTVSPSGLIKTPSDFDFRANAIIGNEKNPSQELVRLPLRENRPVPKTITKRGFNPFSEEGWHCQVVWPLHFGYQGAMKLPSNFPRLKGFRFPREIVAYAVWIYHRFALSTADVEDLLAERGVLVSRETVRLWINRFGRHFADCIRKGQPQPKDKWHLDEAVIMIGGKKLWLWRAIDADGDVLDILVQARRNTTAAKRFFSRLVKQFGQPRVVVTDKLRSYIKPIQKFAPNADHRAHKGLNNRIENSHRLSRKREKIMGRFKSPRQAQRFLSAHDQINTIFRPRRYNLTAISYRHARTDAFALWRDYTAEMTA